jgi:mono/diheme cytochrome c family protein
VNDQDKQFLKARYQEEKEQGEKFFPDIIYKDTVVAFSLFLLLLGLAAFVGVDQKPPADPSDTSYIPRPEWYFLFLFEMLKFFPGQIEFIGTVIIPGAVILLLFLLPLYDRGIKRHPLNRRLATAIMSIAVLAIIGLTIRAVITTPPQAEAVGLTYVERVTAGEDLYLTHCAECHQPDGEGGLVVGVDGLEGRTLDPINSTDFLYTRTDETIYNIIDYGQPNLGMPPYGVANGGELNGQQMDAIVTFMRSWDDRVVIEMPAQMVVELAEGEIPDYEMHVYPIFRRYCIACHREGNAQQNYIMTDHQNVMTGGDHAPNVVGGDLNNNLIRMLRREDIEAGGPMPPTRPLDEKRLDIIIRWVEAGALPVRHIEPEDAQQQETP